MNILVYTDGEVIGDGVIKLPFAAALKRALPQTRLTWLCGGKTVYGGVLQELAQGIIDDIQFLPSRELPMADFLRGPVLERHFDVVLDTQSRLKRTLWLRRRIRHGLFISATWRYTFSDRQPAVRSSAPSPLIEHLMVLGSVGVGHSLASQAIKLPDPKWQAAARKLLPVGPRYIGFVPGAGQPNKRWPLERFIALAKRQAERGFVPVVILGPMEAEMEHSIRNALPTALLPCSEGFLSGPCLTIALAQRLAAAVANDSGGGHLVAAGGPPMVSLFRSPSVRIKFIPASPRVAAFTPHDFGGDTMEVIPLDTIDSALLRLLSGP